MRLEHSPSSDAAYVSVVDEIPDGAVDHTENVSRGRQYERGIDYDARGAILGYEFLNVSRGVDLSDLPHRDELAELFERQSIRVIAS